MPGVEGAVTEVVLRQEAARRPGAHMHLTVTRSDGSTAAVSL